MSNVMLIGRGVVLVLVNVVLRRVLNPLEDSVEGRRLFLFRRWSGGGVGPNAGLSDGSLRS